MKFLHMGDCHLGGWGPQELRALNFKSFQIAVNRAIEVKVDFVLIAGDLFDSAYPSIDILKEAFQEFRRLRDARIPVFLIAGSHDYSSSGKSFLDVLAKAGFCKNVCEYEERNENIVLLPSIYGNVAVYGYSGKKSGLEVEDIERIKLQEAPGLFKILVLHTAIRDAIGNLPIKAVDERRLPRVNYLALGHLHINYCKEGRVYSGPIFPNNISELEELKYGGFYIYYDGLIKKEDIKIKEVKVYEYEIKDAMSAGDEIVNMFENEQLKNKIVILKVYGVLEKGKLSDINFKKVEDYMKKREVYSFLKSTSKLHVMEPEIEIENMDTGNLEEEIITNFVDKNKNKFNYLIKDMISALNKEKQDEEKALVFEERIISESKKVLKI